MKPGYIHAEVWGGKDVVCSDKVQQVTYKEMEGNETYLKVWWC